MKIDAAKMRPVPSELQKSGEGPRRPSIFTSATRSEIVYLSPTQLTPYKKQVRQNFDEAELEQLALTIAEHGIRQPLTVLRNNEDEANFEVVSGERRLRAAIRAGLSRLPCIVLENSADAEEIALIENIQRQDLHPLETSRAIRDLVDKGNHGRQKDLTDRLGMSKSQISEFMKLSHLDDTIQNRLITENIRSRDHLRTILKIDTIEQQLDYIAKITNSSHGPLTRTATPQSMSVLRIALEQDTFKIQYGGISRLRDDQKEQLKDLLVNVLNLL